MKKFIIALVLVLFSSVLWADVHSEVKATIGKMPAWNNGKQVDDVKSGLRQPETPEKKATHDDAIATSNGSEKTSNSASAGGIGSAASSLTSIMGF